MTPVIQFDRVSKRYSLGLTRRSVPSALGDWIRRSTGKTRGEPNSAQSIWALRDVSFELNEGESLALVGPNGAGKTTVLKLLAKITRPTTGRIELRGSLSALIELGAGFHPELTGRENIFLNGTILGMGRPELRRRFDEIVEFAELARFIDTPVKRYSSGMVVRLGFAVASCIRPEILLVDEVLAVGDASFRRKCVTRIRDLLDQGTSLVFVSHNLWLVQAICRKAVYLDGGKIMCLGATQEVLDAYDRALSERRDHQLEQPESGTDVAGAGVEITGIDIARPGASADGDLRNDEPVEIRIRYLTEQNFGPANIVVRIIRNDGITCCMMRTRLDGAQISLSRGAGIVSLLIDELQLYGGSYYVQAIIRDADDSIGVTSSTSEGFYVKGNVLSHQEMNGVFEPRRQWHHSHESKLIEPKQAAGAIRDVH